MGGGHACCSGAQPGRVARGPPGAVARRCRRRWVAERSIHPTIPSRILAAAVAAVAAVAAAIPAPAATIPASAAAILALAAAIQPPAVAIPSPATATTAAAPR